MWKVNRRRPRHINRETEGMEKGGGEEREAARMKRLKSLFVGSAWKKEDDEM